MITVKQIYVVNVRKGYKKVDKSKILVAEAVLAVNIPHLNDLNKPDIVLGVTSLFHYYFCRLEAASFGIHFTSFFFSVPFQRWIHSKKYSIGFCRHHFCTS